MTAARTAGCLMADRNIYLLIYNNRQTSLGRNFALEGVILIIRYIEQNQVSIDQEKNKVLFFKLITFISPHKHIIFVVTLPLQLKPT